MCEISIIIPVYNVEKYLRDCLESVFSQAFNDMEVICINDVSTDKSLEILQKYAQKDSRVKIINNCKNSGLSFSRNVGLREAKGTYIMFLDSDDMLADNALKELHTYIEKNDVQGMVYNREVRLESETAKKCYQFLSQTEQKFAKSDIISGKDLFIEMAEEKCWKTEVWRYLWKRKFLLENKLFFYEGIFHEDELYSFKSLMKAEKILCVNKKYYIYRRRDESITSTIKYRHVESLFLIFNEVYNIWKTETFDASVEQAIETYLDYIFSHFQTRKKYFAEYQPLSLGNSADNYLFQKLFQMGKQQRKYAFLEEQKFNQIRNFERVIVYGAGLVGSETIELLEENAIKIDAVAVTSKSGNADQIKGYDIYTIQELSQWKEDAIVILAVVEKYHAAIIENLKENGFINVILLDSK